MSKLLKDNRIISGKVYKAVTQIDGFSQSVISRLTELGAIITEEVVEVVDVPEKSLKTGAVKRKPK